MKLSIILLVLVLETFGYPTKENSTVADAETDATQHFGEDDDSDMYLEPDGQAQPAQNQDELQPGSQNFFPSFSLFNNPPLGHSRPFFYQQEGAYSQRPSSYRQQLAYDGFPAVRTEFTQEARVTPQSILGSGNFGVIKGGTFYPDNEEGSQYSAGQQYNTFSPYYHNGHGRPSVYFGTTNPRPSQEQFANFRDFADINTPSNPAYSQYVVVYVNKNGTKNETAVHKEPKNIIERLAMLDLETTTIEAPLKKQSQSKRKLALLPPEKKSVKNTKTTTAAPKDLYEPLLALS